MKVFGLDFTSAPRQAKPLTLAVCDLENGVLRLTERRPLVGTNLAPFQAMEQWLAEPGPWIAGIDFPFGQPHPLIRDLGWPQVWPEYVATVAASGKRGFETTLRGFKASKPKGEKELYRSTDRKAASRSPMKLENPPVGKMFFEGATRLLSSGVSVQPVRPVAGEVRTIVEAYPALVARKWIGRRQGYKQDDVKKHDDDMRYARCDIVHAVRGRAKNDCRTSVRDRYGVIVEMTDEDAAACVDDHSGDQLDSVLCAIQASWAYGRREHNFGCPANVDVLEGWIVDPEMC